jgi:large subunit ribosomal protein L28
MARRCDLCGKEPRAGIQYTRRGMAKRKGGVGQKITGKTKRVFRPNVQVLKVRDPDGTIRRLRLCVRCLRAANRRGGIQKAVRGHRDRPRPPEPVAAPVPAAEPEAPEDELEPEDEPAGEAAPAPEA